MKIEFLGANNTVTGSKHLLSVGGRKILIDCGLFQGLKVLRQRNWRPLPFDPATLDAVILTHAHVDHSGYLPLLVRQGFTGPIYCSTATRALCELLLPDAGHLQEEDAAFANKHRHSKHHPALPLYTEADARVVLRNLCPVAWEQAVSLASGVEFRLRKAGHILGASLAIIEGDGRRVVFTGDLGRYDDPTMPPPESVARCDYLVTESTYGDRLHPDEDPREVLREIILRALDRGGRLLVPAFAVGRSQQLLYLIWSLRESGDIPNVPVYLNSPMAIQATRIFCEFVQDQVLTAEQCQGMADMVHFVTTMEESKRINEEDFPAIIISASGMATGGRVLHHLKKLAPDAKNTILFVGFQAAGTRGEAMLAGVEEIKIHGNYAPIRAEVIGMESLSAHADRDEIIHWLRQFERPPRQTFVVHGEPLASEALRKTIQRELDWSVAVPDYLEERTLL